MTLAELPYTTADLFPTGDFNFHMRFRRGDIAQFYRNSTRPEILLERQKWLAENPGRYAIALPGSEPLLNETSELAGRASVAASLLSVGAAWEPDFLLLQAPSTTAQPILLAGCVCFPSSWALEEKIGRPLDTIHTPVPTLNAQFANSVQQFLSRLKPGISWERINWGLSRSPELNQHPARNLPRLDSNVTIDEVWFRAEYQSLVSLPKTGGILFGIRLVIEPLAKLRASPEFAAGLVRAIQSMPEEIARYKGIAPARERLLELLR
jgi:hypothetical protein